jgi:hypothetical protein
MLDRQLWLLELGRGAKSIKNQFVGHADPSLRNEKRASWCKPFLKLVVSHFVFLHLGVVPFGATRGGNTRNPDSQSWVFGRNFSIEQMEWYNRELGPFAVIFWLNVGWYDVGDHVKKQSAIVVWWLDVNNGTKWGDFEWTQLRVD